MQAFLNWARMIKIEHTFFSLPFALSSSLLAMHFVHAYKFLNLFWACLALFGARSMAMTLNRIIDLRIDSINPRTQNRELPSKKISLKSAWIMAFISCLIFVYSSFQLPKLCQILLPIAVLWLWAYSYFKRFTYLCHFALGLSVAGASLGAWIAVTGSCDSLAPIFLSMAVLTWVSAFDVIYAIQDFEFDRSFQIQSIPSRFGIQASIQVAKFLHLLTPIFLYLVCIELNLGLCFKLGILFVIFALIFEQKLIKEGQIEKAFFDINVWISVVILFFVILEIRFS